MRGDGMEFDSCEMATKSRVGKFPSQNCFRFPARWKISAGRSQPGASATSQQRSQQQYRPSQATDEHRIWFVVDQRLAPDTNGGTADPVDFRPKVHTPLMDSYYTPGTRLDGRCLYPFLHARVSFSGKVYFCPFIRVEVGDLTKNTLEEVWNGEQYVKMRKQLLEHGIFPVCRRCCKVELSPTPAVATADLPKRRTIPMTVVHN